MIASFRRLSNSKIGTAILVLFMVGILASFAWGDILNLGLGTGSGGRNGATLAKVGGTAVTEQEVSEELRLRLDQLRQQNPQASMADLDPAFEPVLSGLIDQLALKTFAEKHGFVLSKRLVDAKIANLPAAKGVDGKFSEQAYQAFLSQQRLTDATLRRLIEQDTLQQMLLQPLVVSPRIPVGVATPYASVLMESRQGEAAIIPASVFAAGLKPTDAQLQAFYTANRARYTVPEQRVLRFARIGAEQVANVAPSDQEIAAEYQRDRASYAPKSLRVLSQVVTPSQAVANAVAAAAKSKGNTLQAAAQGKGDAAFSSLGEQTREQLATLAGGQVAAAAFGAAEGSIVGPVRSDFGWHVLKIEDVREQPGKSLAEARSEIAARLTDAKRKSAIADLVDKVDGAIADGKNFEEAAKEAGLQIQQTPLITADGTSRAAPAFKLPADMAAAVQRGFELGDGDDPEVVALNQEGTENVLVAAAQIVPPAPAPLATIKDRVTQDWIRQEASSRAKAVANAIAAKVARGVPMAQAVRESGVSLPAPAPVNVRRIDISRAQAQVPAPIQMLFNLKQGQSRTVADPATGNFAVVKLNRIVPGNASLNPGLIAQVQRDFQQSTLVEYARQFMAAVRKSVGVKRHEEAIAEAKKRILAGS